MLRSLKNEHLILITAKDYYSAMQKVLPKEEKEKYTVAKAYAAMADFGEPSYIDGSVQPVWEIPDTALPQQEDL